MELPDLAAPRGDLQFMLGVLFNQQVRAETAWRAPVRLGERLGGLDVHQLAATAPDSLAAVMQQRPAVHPFAVAMAAHVIAMCERLIALYDGQAAKVWDDCPPAATLLRRLTAFPGIGHHKATVAIALLTREYDLPLTGPADDLAAQALASCPRLSEVLVT
ncbi:hypothetical protein [Actinomadura sp. NBRC 104412]|uniref:hypothetical protein n=1 Tax=Actinomadura sp. NBRC 104412 TaxID=3032203 RepID=UPI0025524676|nr:hypothetical protein [Actinomadura sp. NBRC 104412]